MSLQSYDCHSISLQVLMFLAALLFALTVCNCFVNGGINPDLLAEFFFPVDMRWEYPNDAH